MKLDEIRTRVRERMGKLNSKTGKIAAILMLAMFMATASASVFVTYYGHGTATAQTPDVQLAAGADNIGGTKYPTGTVTISSTMDYADVGISFFASETQTPQPATYFTDLLQIDNVGTVSHNITQVAISGIVDADTILGQITVYFCTSQTNDPANNNVGHFDITSTTGGNVLGATQEIAAGSTVYLEIVAYANATATTGQSVTFDMAVQWV